MEDEFKGLQAALTTEALNLHYGSFHALKEVDFRGNIIADHIPDMVGGRYAGFAYAIAYMKAMLVLA